MIITRRLRVKTFPIAFSKHFIEVGQRLCREIPEARKQPEYYIKICNAQFQFREVSQNEVFELLPNISTNKQQVLIKFLLNL